MSAFTPKAVAKSALGIEWKDTESAARRVAEYAATLIAEVQEQKAKPVRREVKREATLSMTLNADSGYASSETHRISADQWERIVRIANEATQ